MAISFDLQKSDWPREEWLPLNWLYSLKNLELTPIRTGHPEFLLCQPSELKDPGEFLVQGAVVLTVGLAFENSTEDFHGYTRRLAEIGAVGIGFGTGLVFESVPDDLITAAEETGLALFEVPRRIPFLSILTAVQSERLRRSRRQQERLLDIQEKLNSAAIHGGLQELIDTTSDFLAAAIAISDNDGRIVATHDRGQVKASAHAREVATAGKALSSADTVGNLHRIMQRMEQQGERTHLMVVIAEHTFHGPERSIIKHAAGLADILLQRPIYLRRARNELNTLALSLLLHIDAGDQAMDSVLDSVSDASGRVRPVLIHADRALPLNRALKHLDTSLANQGRYLFALDTGPLSRLILVRGSRTVQDVVSRFGAAGSSIRIAVGEPVPWRELTMERVRALEVAVQTLSLGDAAGPYEAGSGWLQDDAVRQALDRRAAETVDRLTTHDAEKSTDLMRTLEAYLRSGGAASAAASSLGVHRHTLRTRITQIEDICEVDLSDPFTRAELLLVTVTRVV
ncbi:PucR family transcriptional regulator [Corynebacterium pacaense]|uniref:PucR family transcriptional regulator n=1 Tax=Corynebacterium pacaense TaxID=1816684 RepID=UPI001FE3F371|nr:PucR family transcriptional regulator [Corynebacterium pacaense]